MKIRRRLALVILGAFLVLAGFVSAALVSGTSLAALVTTSTGANQGDEDKVFTIDNPNVSCASPAEGTKIELRGDQKSITITSQQPIDMVSIKSGSNAGIVSVVWHSNLSVTITLTQGVSNYVVFTCAPGTTTTGTTGTTTTGTTTTSTTTTATTTTGTTGTTTTGTTGTSTTGTTTSGTTTTTGTTTGGVAGTTTTVTTPTTTTTTAAGGTTRPPKAQPKPKPKPRGAVKGRTESRPRALAYTP